MGNCLNKSRRQVQPSCTVDAKASVKSGKRKSKNTFNFRKYSARVGVQTDERKTTEVISADDAVIIEDLLDQHVAESVLVSFCSHSNLYEVKDDKANTLKLQASQRDSPFFASNESIYEEFTENDGEIEEEIYEEDDEDDSAGKFVDDVMDKNEPYIDLSAGKVNLDFNEVEKAIKRLYNLREKTPTPSQKVHEETDEGAHDFDNTGNNENADVLFDDKCVLDNLPDNSKIADETGTPNQMENELTSTLNDDIKQEETMRNSNKRTEDTNCHDNELSYPVCLPKSKGVSLASLPLVRHKESDKDSKSIILVKTSSENNVLYEKSKENNNFKDENCRENEHSDQDCKESDNDSKSIILEKTSSEKNVLYEKSKENNNFKDENCRENEHSNQVYLPKESDNDSKSIILEKTSSENNVLYKKSKENNNFKAENCHEDEHSNPVCLTESKGVSSASLSLVAHKESDNNPKSMELEKATSENNVLYKKSKKNSKFKDEKTKSLILLITKESLEKVENHNSRSDCGFSVYVSSPEEKEPLRLIQIHATNKQVQDGSAKSFIKLIRNASTNLQFFDPFPEAKKKSRGNHQTCSNLVDRNAKVYWTAKQGPSTNISLTRVPKFHEAPPKAKSIRESFGMEKLRSYGIIPQCKEIERIKIDEEQFPGILPPKIQKKWNKKMKEKKCIN